jgi:hypothetical protein
VIAIFLFMGRGGGDPHSANRKIESAGGAGLIGAGVRVFSEAGIGGGGGGDEIEMRLLITSCCL